MSLLGHNLVEVTVHITLCSVSPLVKKQPLFIWGQLQEVLGPWAEATPPGCNECHKNKAPPPLLSPWLKDEEKKINTKTKTQDDQLSNQWSKQTQAGDS